MNDASRKPLPSWLPLAVGAVVVALFTSLGAWQVSRGLEKREQHQLFSEETGFTAWYDGMEVYPFRRLKATGTYDAGRQVLLENIIVRQRSGYYVITPLAGLDGEPSLLVNRGWIEAWPDDTVNLDVPTGRITVRGRVGRLPLPGMKMGAAFSEGDGWPKRAVYPSYDEVAAALGQDVQDFVLLLDAEEEHGFFREWVPSGFGPGKHFGYALQWFAMGSVLSVLLIWNYRKKRIR